MIKFGFVGLYGINKWHYLPGILKSEKAELIAGVDPSEKARKGFQELTDVPLYATFQAMIDKHHMDAVIIGTPNPIHLINIKEAVAAGLHISVTKPLCNTVAESLEAIKLCKNKNLILQVGHEYRFRPAVRKGLEIALSGEIGKITLLTAHMGSQGGLGKLTTTGTWRSKAVNVPGGCLNLLGVHMFDVANCLLGKPVSLTANIKKLLTEAELDDMAAVTVDYENGAVAVITSSYVSAPSDFIHIFGTKENLLITDTSLWREVNREMVPVDLDNETGSAQIVIEQLCDAIISGRPLDTPGEAGLSTVAMNEAAVKSAANHNLNCPILNS
ncbi:MAG: Gfo/Idh/MocA family oxidoreductase [Victivallaceae bacterium]|nr:Gfo/Idh/MocA family oxidoreductase [Victivallaceae bacterium]